MSNQNFVELEKQVRTNFEPKRNVNLYNGNMLKFNGAVIKNDGKSLTILQPENILKLSKLDLKNFTKQQFIAERFRGAYIAAACRLDFTHSFSRPTKTQNQPSKKWNI